MTRFTNFGSRGAPRADLHVKHPSTMGHESLIQRRPSLSHPPGLAKIFFSDIQSVTLNYRTPRHIGLNIKVNLNLTIMNTELLILISRCTQGYVFKG